MAVTYDQAREIVRGHFQDRWTHGTFCLDDREIAENDKFYAFLVGAREYLIDGDESYEAVGSSVPVVYKEDGRLDFLFSPAVAMDVSIRRRPNPNPTLKV
jgi:hypothetical protein